MRHQRVDLLKLVASDQPRPLITEAVDKLASSIRDIGLVQPITVRQRSIMSGGLAEQGFQVVAGHHRVAACRALGLAEIDAIVIEAGEHLQAELIEIDENLCRSELTASQRAQANTQAGLRIDDQLSSLGWYLQVTDPLSASVRTERGSPIVNFWYCDGGSIQKLVVSSTTVL